MFRSKTSVGVDIGAKTVKVVQLKRTKTGLALEKMATAEIYLGEEPSEDPAEQRKAKIDAVKRALADAKITAKGAVSAVSGESIIVRYLQLPDMPEDELKKALQWEAEEYIPFRLDEVNLDSMVLGKSDNEGDRVDVLLVSAKKDLVEEHISVIREAGLTPKVVDVDSFAFLNCFEANYEHSPEEYVALINIGAEITGICIYNDGVSRFSRDIPVGGDTITSAIRSHLRCGYAEAENLKIIHGVSMPDENTTETTATISGSLMETIRGRVEEMTDTVTEANKDELISQAIGTVVGELISEVRRSIEFFENQMQEASVSRVILGGGSSMMLNLREQFETDLGLSVEVIDPLRNIRPASKDIDPESLEIVRHGLGVGIGLGLRGLAA